MSENTSASVQFPTDGRVARLAYRCDSMDTEVVIQLFDDILTIIEALDAAGSLSHARVIGLMESELDKEQKETDFINLLKAAGLIGARGTSYELGPTFD